MIGALKSYIISHLINSSSKKRVKRFIEIFDIPNSTTVALSLRYNLLEKSLFVGENCCLDGMLYTVGKGRIRIGSNCSFRSKTFIGSIDSITIGNNVFGAEQIYICDSNNHPTQPIDRLEMTKSPPNTEPWKWSNPKVISKPIVINDNVWLGRCAMIMKGVEIGEGSIIAAGAIVTKNVPPNTIVGGNPAKVIKHLKNE